MIGGYGIKNLISRLELYYSKNYSFDIHSEIGKGTVVTLKLPVSDEEEKVKTQ